MDILYYSNYCQNSKKVLQFITKNGLVEKIKKDLSKKIAADGFKNISQVVGISCKL